MKNYTITVNGNIYEVSVEESSNTNTAVTPVQPTVAAKAAPVAQAKKAPVAKPAASAGGSVKVSSPMPGKILSVKADAGASVKRGDVILILEAMKMENEIVAPEDGTVASVNVSAGQTVEAGDLLATLN